MELVEIIRYVSKSADVNAAAGNFHQFVNCPLTRQSITQWDKDLGKIRFDVAHEVRKSSVVSGLQLQVAVNSVLYILADNILADDIWDFNDFLMVAPSLHDIVAFGDDAGRGTSCVSILFYVNASGSSLNRAEVVKALRPQVLGERLARAHGKSRGKDPFTGETWKQLRIERLPPISTSVAQSLDVGIINTFKRHYLEMLSNKSVTKEYATEEKITNSEAWSYIPYAWSHVKALTVMGGDKIQFSFDKNQKGAQDMAEEIKQKVRKKIALYRA
ncbi:hypothetical protein KI688_001189 [Linnemannia hyalina]|uniref:DDE-1 domain-containing protein n=1 Tax=Linnemannia hyalina TaxID=64524 RepID=A0A9P7Y7F5_9FUNG|nr:hypothetical protein KI688_001189 [Linnemannia hyalina]